MKQIKEELERELPEAATLRTLIGEFKQNERDMVDARIKQGIYHCPNCGALFVDVTDECFQCGWEKEVYESGKDIQA